MNVFKGLRSISIKKLPKILLGSFIVIILIVALIISANNIMKYIYIKQENELWQKKYDNKIKEVDELQYYLNSEVNDAYKERMARLLGYCYPDEIIYYIE